MPNKIQPREYSRGGETGGTLYIFTAMPTASCTSVTSIGTATSGTGTTTGSTTISTARIRLRCATHFISPLEFFRRSFVSRRGTKRLLRAGRTSRPPFGQSLQVARKGQYIFCCREILSPKGSRAEFSGCPVYESPRGQKEIFLREVEKQPSLASRSFPRTDRRSFALKYAVGWWVGVG